MRFNGFERFVHWLTAICFIVLALTGLNSPSASWLLLPADRAGDLHARSRSGANTPITT